jgi:ubiquinone/menaquinone biosynthesis C-methylase UbiE
MTNFSKVKDYYNNFDEENRLFKDNSGKLEFDMTMNILNSNIPNDGTILDLGGGTGIYSFELAKRGYKVYLADLSDKLCSIARDKKNNINANNICSIDVVNAIDLSIYDDNYFDVVLLFGPMYHLLDEDEREKCISEVNRVLKNGGLVFASYIPYLSGSIAILDRYFRHPEQVNIDNLDYVFESGKFNNLDINGFQEGYYPKTLEIEKLFNKYNFEKKCIRSIRGFGYGKEDNIYSLDSEMFNKVIELINKTSTDSSIIETCGHAMYIGQKI